MSVRTKAPSKWNLIDKIRGPRVTKDDVILLKAKAQLEGWDDWLEMMMGDPTKPLRKRRMLLAYLRDGLISVEVHTIVLEDEEE